MTLVVLKGKETLGGGGSETLKFSFGLLKVTKVDYVLEEKLYFVSSPEVSQADTIQFKGGKPETQK